MINLLPEEQKSDKLTFHLAIIAKNLAVVLFVLLFISVAVIAGILITQNSNLSQIESHQQELIASIKNLEQTEKNLFLLKERLAKIKTLFDFPQSQKDLTVGIESLLGGDPEIMVSEIEISPEKTSLLVRSTASGKAGDYLEGLLASDLYQEIKLTAFSYNPAAGYSLNLEITQK
jgi:hypothetical protein